MICLRCGKCCQLLDIFIVNPSSILPDGRLDTKDPWAMIPKPAGERCPHLSWESDLAVCTIHHLPCYQGTPCQQFEQVGPEEAACITKGYFEIHGR
ncbi:Uncharacterised protein [uncultured archaeon]|nr:Uncharacterised protein [uncultured archaeon]